MGEQKRREAQQTPYEAQIDALARKLANEGRLIEAGWLGLRKLWVPEGTGDQQVRDLRWAFMAGAQHVFGSLLTIMDEDREPTPADLYRMDLIDDELKAFAAEVVAAMPVEGSA